jgi:FKBP-type peptidyl-prolyl cis-trans isomerase 2
MTIKNGDKVKVHYTGSLDNGTVFDSSEAREPIEFTVGSGQLIKGFDQGVIGMKKGEEKVIHIKAADAYGEHSDKLIRKVERNLLPKDREPQVGMVMGLVRSDGMQAEARIIEVNPENILIDMNHPLAGKNLNFKIRIVEIN